MEANSTRSLRGAISAAAMCVAIAACNQSTTTGAGGAYSATSTTTSSSSQGIPGCATPCDASHPCADPRLQCMPSAKGGSICKPKDCPACPLGTFCSVDNTTCAPRGCTSLACGFGFVDACDACVRASACCGEALTCANDPACVAIVNCAGACSSQSCVDGCAATASPAARAEYTKAFSCVDTTCAAQCGASTSSTTSASTGTATSATTSAVSTGSGTPVCNPPCLANETCKEVGPAHSGVYGCTGDPCLNTVCPSVTCKDHSGGSGQFGGCTALLYGPQLAASCNKALNSMDTALETCTASPSNSMHCSFPEGDITCPAIYISPAPPYTPVYIEGCCSNEIVYDNGSSNPPHASPFCGVPATTGCSPIDPGNPNWYPAP